MVNMISKRMKIKVVAAIAFMAFLGSVAFGLIFMMDSTMKMDQPMANECPFTMFGSQECPQSALGAVVHHISLYQSFTNVPVNFGLAAIIISLFFVISAILAVFLNNSLFGLPALVGIFYSPPPNTLYKSKVTRWLALHENSPATS